jgi:peroxiredoxin
MEDSATLAMTEDCAGVIQFATCSLKQRLQPSWAFVVVNVWGTWCGPCVGEAADIDTFYKKFKADSNVALVTVSYGDTPQAVRAFMASRRLTFPVLMDDGHWVDQKLHVPAYPTTYVVHRTGRIVYQPGTRTDLVDEWTWMVEAALKRPR